MQLTRRSFLVSSLAVLATAPIALRAAEASPALGRDTLDRNTTYMVWRAVSATERRYIGTFSGVTKYPVPKGCFLTTQDMQRITRSNQQMET